ncbi:hypothetical protein KUTeg_024567 [Tegillarca granosa]|uniref:EGF-like domain-containing protein n=1 Tax=Tegillarca granosa TaxID=220873 RepID=A0ABQ9E0R6_TEGGR|nr:hypothetical protein KUTeg_024567 [Tegillarca granosa]
MTSAQKCFAPLIYDMNQCITYQCKMNGKCIDLWHRAVCKCPHGYKRPDCSKKITCADSPCRDNQSCVESEGTYKCIVPEHSTIPTVAIVTGSIAAFMAVAGSAFGLGYYVKKKKENPITPETNKEV